MGLRSFALVAVWAVALAGCKPAERDVCRVAGAARFAGQPLAGFHVVLYSETAGGGGTAVRPDGGFEFSGPLPEGEYAVSFVIPADTKGEARGKAEAMELPAKYRRGETSDYKVTLVPGRNVLDIDLKP